MVDIYSRQAIIEYAEPNYIARITWSPNDTDYSKQWHFYNATYGGINLEAAWDLDTTIPLYGGDPSIVVAVIDTGVAYKDLAGPGFWHLSTYNAYNGSGYSWWLGVSSALSGWTALYGAAPTPPGYGNGWKQYLQHSFDLTGASGTITFSYYYKYDIERDYDYFYVDVSDDSGATWTTLKTYTNNSGPFGDVDWTSDSVDLTAYSGGTVLVRFRFNSDDLWSDEDGNFDSDGAVYIDEVTLTDSSGILWEDDMEGGAGTWETTAYEQAPDLASTNFWVNSGETVNGSDDDLNGYIDDINGWDFVNSDAYPNDDGAHGTHVTGTIAQSTNNSLGVAGIAFNTTIMPVKVLSAGGSGTYAWIADAIRYAADNGADIISMSLGGSAASTTLEDAVEYAHNAGVTILVASGNGDSNRLDYPAAYDDYVIVVGATRYDETRSWYSNYGLGLDIVAPGGDTRDRVDQNSDGNPDGVYQQTFGDTPVDWAYYFYQGTSMATPHAAGVAALILAQNPTWTPAQVRHALESTTEDLGVSGRDDTYGWGLIDAYAAVNSSLATATSYKDSGHTTETNDFSDYGTEHTVYMYSTGLLPSYQYRVAYYDGSNNKVATDDVSSDSSGNLSSEHTFADGSDAAGIWNAVVSGRTYTPPSTYNSSWSYTITSDTFTVQGSAIPEFPTALAAMVALALSAGVYLWMRRKAAPVTA